MALVRETRFDFALRPTSAFDRPRCPVKCTPAAKSDSIFFPDPDTTSRLPFWPSVPAVWAATAREWESRHGRPPRAPSGRKTGPVPAGSARRSSSTCPAASRGPKGPSHGLNCGDIYAVGFGAYAGFGDARGTARGGSIYKYVQWTV